MASTATSASPPESMHERRASIDKKLQQRPESKELVDRHILLDTKAAPALQAQQRDLSKQKTSDELKKKLHVRPEKEELMERNILPTSNAAPSLQAQQKELQKNMRQNSLEKQLQRRPTADDLKEQGILKENESAVSPTEEAVVEEK